jgi:hypothetical protein
MKWRGFALLASVIALLACTSTKPNAQAGATPRTTTPATVGTTTSATAEPATVGTTINCPQVGIRPHSSDLADEVTATGTDCATATSVIRTGPDRGDPRSGHDYDSEGFHCVAGSETQPPGGGISHYPYDCDNGMGATITFNRY